MLGGGGGVGLGQLGTVGSWEVAVSYFLYFFFFWSYFPHLLGVGSSFSFDFLLSQYIWMFAFWD